MITVTYVSVAAAAIMAAVLIFAHWQKAQDDKRDALKRDNEAEKDD